MTTFTSQAHIEESLAFEEYQEMLALRESENNMTPLEKLQAMPIAGNAHDDQELFQMADAIIRDENQTFEDRIAAMRVIDNAMGEDGEDLMLDPAKALAEYLELTTS